MTVSVDTNTPDDCNCWH